jgi:hypothetical protein
MRLNEVIKTYNIPVVFIESTINPKLLEQVAADNHITVGGKLYSDSLGEEDSPANTYLNMIRYNTDVIVKGLTSKSSDTSSKSELGVPTMLIFFGIGIILMLIGIFLWRKRIFAA